MSRRPPGLTVIGGGGATTPAPASAPPIPALDPTAEAVLQTPGVVAEDPDSGRPTLVPLAVVDALRAHMSLAWRGDQPWRWGGRCWVPAERTVQRVLQHVAAGVWPHGTRHIAAGRALYDLLCAELRASAPPTPEAAAAYWDARPVWPCENGTVDWSDPQRPAFRSGRWDPDDHMTYSIDAAWDPDAWDMAVIDWLESVLPEPALRSALLEALGYTLARWDLRNQVLIFLIGHGSNGKSLFLRVLQHLLPGYIASVSLATLAGDRFAGSRCVFR